MKELGIEVVKCLRKLVLALIHSRNKPKIEN